MTEIRTDFKSFIKENPQKLAHLEFTPHVSSEELHQALDRMLGLSGCPQCGLNGIDIRFSRILELKQELTKLPSLVSAQIMDDPVPIAPVFRQR
ncbi:MAG: hypothetical protein LUQ26_12040 [Methylococcaceae bacterium]|nr:hypothetical protein [Methylococcaceae bacterium]